MTFFKRKHPGFTLIETAIVLFIISTHVTDLAQFKYAT